MKKKKVYIICGPNGAGKTTFATKFLPEYVRCSNFVNADFIAQGLSPFSPGQMAVKAGKLVLQQINELSEKGFDFGFETTLSGKTHLKKFNHLKNRGYGIHLFFLWIPSEKLAIARVKDRVLTGGHNVAKSDIKRRFKKSINNLFKVYLPLSDSWMLFDNSGIKPNLIAKRNNGNIQVFNDKLLTKILERVGTKL